MSIEFRLDSIFNKATFLRLNRICANESVISLRPTSLGFSARYFCNRSVILPVLSLEASLTTITCYLSFGYVKLVIRWINRPMTFSSLKAGMRMETTGSNVKSKGGYGLFGP